MKKLFSLVVAIFVLAGTVSAFAIDIYTFKKERVDQELKGNRGYLSGKAPARPSGGMKKERTLIGIDIELPASFFPGGRDLDADETPRARVASQRKSPQVQKAQIVEVEEDGYIK